MRTIFLIILVLLAQNLCSQEYKDLDVVIVINGDVAISVSSAMFVVKDTLGNERKIEIAYHPGNLSMLQSEYENIIADDIDSVTLTFSYFDYSIKKKGEHYSYEIPYSKGWLQVYYNVLYIYNLEISKYKKTFAPLSKNQNYTFELTGPSCTFLRERK